MYNSKAKTQKLSLGKVKKVVKLSGEISVYGQMHLKKYFQLTEFVFCCYLSFSFKVWFPIKSVVSLELISINELLFCPAYAQ